MLKGKTVLLGVTGSGKTFTMASIIEKVQKPTLVLAHNKTLAAQLCAEFREFFPENAVEYFISYYDYYQPEAYIAHTDTYIEKDSSVNEEIERLRHSATSSLSERKDVIVVSSVSCIYGLGDPIDYKNMVISLRAGQARPLQGRRMPYNPFTSAISCSTASSFVAQLVHTRTAVWCLSGLPMWVMA